MNKTPPPIIDSARVISYAFVGDIEYKKSGKLFSGDRLVEKVPNLAICLNLGKDLGYMIFHCDEDWNTQGVSGGKTLQDAKLRAEKNYPSVSARWVDINTSEEEALIFYDQEPGNEKCAFCGLRPFEVTGRIIYGNNAAVCEQCIKDLYVAIHSDS